MGQWVDILGAYNWKDFCIWDAKGLIFGGVYFQGGSVLEVYRRSIVGVILVVGSRVWFLSGNQKSFSWVNGIDKHPRITCSNMMPHHAHHNFVYDIYREILAKLRNKNVREFCIAKLGLAGLLSLPYPRWTSWWIARCCPWYRSPVIFTSQIKS